MYWFLRVLRRLTVPVGIVALEVAVLVIGLAAFVVWAFSGYHTFKWVDDFLEGPVSTYQAWVKK